MPRPVLDFWFDFASTYSYLAAMRIGPLAERADVRVRFRPFLLGPIFKAQGWTTSPFNLYPAKGRNMWRDLERSCADLQLAFRRPDPFPQNSLLAARVALAGLDQTWGEGFCRALFCAEFADGCRIDDAAAIANILAKWKIEAASTAVACPSRMPSTRCSNVPPPPEAITGTGTASATARVSGMSKPCLVPSRSMDVSRISPAPSAATSRA